MAYSIIKPKRGTASQWGESNPILKEGEIGFEYPESGVGSGPAKMKMGDGSTHWLDLPYALDGYGNNICKYYGNGSDVTTDNVMDEAAIIYINGDNPLYSIVGSVHAYVFTYFYTSKSVSSNRLQVAYSYNKAVPSMAIRCYINGWTTWQKIPTNNDIENIAAMALQAQNYASNANSSASEAKAIASSANIAAEQAATSIAEAVVAANNAIMKANENSALLGSVWEDVSSQFSLAVASGDISIENYSVHKRGRRYHFSLSVKSTATVSVGSSSSVQVTGVPPAFPQRSCSYSSKSGGLAAFNETGAITFRVIGADWAKGYGMSFQFEYDV